MKNHPPVSYEGFLQQFHRSPSKVSLLYGNGMVFELSLWMAAQASSMGKTIAVVDGCNRFNVHAISRFARQHKVDPGLLLNRVFLSRAFTCYQMEAVMTERLPAFLKRVGSTTALIFGLLETFYDEQAPYREVTQILRRIIATTHGMREEGISLLLVSQEWNVQPPERNRLFYVLKSAVDEVFRLHVTAEHTPLLFRESRKKVLYGSNRSDVYSSHRQ